jgi:hypothetical protein
MFFYSIYRSVLLQLAHSGYKIQSEKKGRVVLLETADQLKPLDGGCFEG